MATRPQCTGGGFRLTRTAAAAAIALGAAPPAAFSAPQGGVVQAGAVRIQQTAPNRLDIVQSSARAAIDWRSFSIGAAEHVNFQQPSASAATLNRVVGTDPSIILGRLTANGQVFLVNRNGILFGQGSKVDVGALVASTANVSNANFMAGRLVFDAGADARATIVNRGEITAARGGLVALVAPGVENAGVIRAQLGRIALASGHAFTLDLYGDQLLRLVVDDAAMDRLTDVEGRTLRSLVANSGRLEADGGSVLLAAGAAKGVLDAAINMSGVVEARGFEQRGGEIVLHAGDGAVQLSGLLDASAHTPGARAGSISVQGRDVTVAAGARIAADAASGGNGGKVVLLGNDDMRFAGTASARGGAQGGDGGFVEVSGRRSLAYRGSADASAPRGRAGTLLLDPTDWIIDTPTADQLSLDLRGGTNVVLQADNLIEVNDSIDGRGGVAGATLSLDAGNRIALNNDLMTNNGAVTLRAGGGGVQMANTSRATSNNGAVIFAGNQPIDIQSTGSVAAQHLVTSGAIGVRATGAGASVTLGRDLNGFGATPVGSLDVQAAGAVSVSGLNASGAAELNAGGTLAFTPSATASFAAASIDATVAGAVTIGRDVVGKGNGAIAITSSGGALTADTARSVASQGSGNVTLTSAGRLTAAGVLTSGAVRLESTADTVDLARDLVGASGSSGLGGVTIRSGAGLTIDDRIRSTRGIDIRAGGTTAGTSRDLAITLGATERLEANVGNAGAKLPILLGGANVDMNGGELHSNGGPITIDARNGRTFMASGAGLFAGAGDLTVQSSGRVDLTRVSTSGDVALTSTGGAIRLDGDLGSDLSGAPQPVGSVTLNAGGSFSQSRTYYTNYDFTLAPGAQTPPTTTVSSPVGVRVRAIDSSGPVSITASQGGAEILSDGVIEANGNVTLNASTVRLRHSVFATGGNITIGGPLLVEPWGDEIGFDCGDTVCNPGAAGDERAILIRTDTYRNGGTTGAGAPGSNVELAPAHLNDFFGTFDLASSQVTLRAQAASGSGGGITLTAGAGRELDIRTDQQLVRLDRAGSDAGFIEPTDEAAATYPRGSFVLVPMNDLRLNLQSTNGVAFRAGSGGTFMFSGTQVDRRLQPNVGATTAINEPYFRLVIASDTGTLDLNPQTVVNASGTPIPNGFAGTLTSLHGYPGSIGFNPGQVLPPGDPSYQARLPGVTYISHHIDPSGVEPPPGATNSDPSQFSVAEITPGSTPGSGSSSAAGTDSGIALADARPIAPPPPPAPLPPPPPPAPPSPSPSPSPPPPPPRLHHHPRRRRRRHLRPGRHLSRRLRPHPRRRLRPHPVLPRRPRRHRRRPRQRRRAPTTRCKSPPRRRRRPSSPKRRSTPRSQPTSVAAPRCAAALPTCSAHDRASPAWPSRVPTSMATTSSCRSSTTSCAGSRAVVDRRCAPAAARWPAPTRRFASALLLAAAEAALAAQPPPETPFLRLDTTMHTARVRKLVVDAPRNRLLTASDDKTVRLWQLPKGRLLRVFRVPIGDGFEGRIYVADMHPDGRVVAAGGWTGWDFDGAGSIYLFDADSGELVRRIGGFPEAIGTLAFSPDGRYLAVGLLGSRGLRVLRTGDYAEVARDLEYGERILDLGFARDGRLAVASLDGYLRLYDASFALVGRRKTTTGKQPLSIKFSPDGELIGVGFNDLAPPAVYRARDLALAWSADAGPLREHRRLQNIQWNDSGDMLYATGEQAGLAATGRIVRWRQRGRGPAESIAVDAQRPGSLWPLAGGRMAFSSEDPLIGTVDASGRVDVIVRSDLADLRAHAGALRLSADASALEFHARAAGDALVRLSLRERSARRVGAADPAFSGPRVDVPAFRLDERPALNGVPLALDDHEFVRSSTVAPDNRLFVLGTEWSVRTFDAQARPLWRYPANGVVWQVVVSADGRSIVAAVGDGTLRWLRAEDGVEYLAAFVHPQTLEWIAWTPQGYYVSSVRGDQLIGWHLNRGRDRSALFYRAVQFERLLYRPDIVDAAFAARDPRPAVAAPRRERAFDIAELRRIAPPLVRLSASASDPGAATPPRARVRIDAQAVNLPMRDLTVYVNNVPITPSRARPLGASDAQSVAREVEVDLAEAENVVRVEISNGESLGLDEIVVDAARPLRPLPDPGGDLYLLAVGINRFPQLKPNQQSADLDFAARDATEVARFFTAEGTRHFRQVHVRVLSDDSPEQPSRRNIVNALDFFANAGARDTVLLFLASHGISDSRGNYYFVPSDATTGDWNGAVGGLDDVPTLIRWSVFFEALRKAAGRRLLMVDTCHARAIEGKLDLHSLAKRSASSIFSLVVAAKADEMSQEYAQGGHGLFTYALLQALRGGADGNGDGLVTLREAFDYAVPIVEANRMRAQPQTPQLHAPWPLDRTVLVRSGR